MWSQTPHHEWWHSICDWLVSNFNFGQGYTPTHSLRQSDILDYRAAYFAAKNAKL